MIVHRSAAIGLALLAMTSFAAAADADRLAPENVETPGSDSSLLRELVLPAETRPAAKIEIDGVETKDQRYGGDADPEMFDQQGVEFWWRRYLQRRDEQR